MYVCEYVCICIYALTAGSHYKSRQGKESLGSLLPISFLLRLYLSVTLWRKKAEDFGEGARSFLSTHWYPVPVLSLTTKSSLGPNPGTCYHRLSRFRCSVFWFQMLFSWLQSLKDFFSLNISLSSFIVSLELHINEASTLALSCTSSSMNTFIFYIWRQLNWGDHRKVVKVINFVLLDWSSSLGTIHCTVKWMSSFCLLAKL